jgi:hypothetical protein
MASNIHSGTQLFQSHLATLKAVFPQVALFRLPSGGNVIAVAVKFREPDLATMIAAVDVTQLPDLQVWGGDFLSMRQNMVMVEDQSPAESAQVLTDDFAPVEFLGIQEVE